MTIEELRDSFENIVSQWGCEESELFAKSNEFLNELEIFLKEYVDNEIKTKNIITIESIYEDIDYVVIGELQSGKLNKAINKYFKRIFPFMNIPSHYKIIFKYWLKITLENGFWKNNINLDKIIEQKFSKELKDSKIESKKILIEQDFETEN